MRRPLLRPRIRPAPVAVRAGARRASRPRLRFAPAAVLLAAACGDAGPAGGLVVVPGPDTQDPARPAFHDLGDVPASGVLRCTYYLRNDAPDTIAIRDVAPGCGCNVPRLSYRDEDGTLVAGASASSDADPLLALPPGRTAELEIAVDTREVNPKNVAKLFSTRITTDHEATAFLTIETRILVESPFQVQAREGRIDIGRVPLSGGGSGETRISLLPGYPMELTGIESVSGGFQATLRHREDALPAYWELRAEIPPPVPAGRHSGLITLGVERSDGAPYPPLEVGVTAFGVPDLQADPARLILVARPDDDVGASVELSSLLPGKRLVVEGTRLEPPSAALAVDASPLAPDAAGRSLRWRLALRATAPVEDDVLHGEVVVSFAGGESMRVPYVVHRP